MGCIGTLRRNRFLKKAGELATARVLLTALSLTPNEANLCGIAVNQDGIRRSAFSLLSLAGVSMIRLASIWPQLAAISPDISRQIETDAAYSVYLDRQKDDLARYRREECLTIPDDIEYASLLGLSNEVRGKLQSVRPRTLGQAGRIEGITPTALTLLASRVRNIPRQRAAKPG